MSKRYATSLFIFRRDLRCDDNLGLIRALQESSQVITCFIFDPRQIREHPYQSKPALAFMLESLDDLNQQLKVKGGRLAVFEGQAQAVIRDIMAGVKVDAVYVNEDYTPFSVNRDLAIKKICEDQGVAFHSCEDLLLHHPRSIFKDGGGAYTIFTPFFNKARQQSVDQPVKVRGSNFYLKPMDGERKNLPQILADLPGRSVKGGRRNALAILQDLKPFKDYNEDRNLPAKSMTTGLSAHHKFGTCSVRETYQAVLSQLGGGHTLIRELYWRDFFTHIGYHFPHVFGHSFYDQYDHLSWSANEEHFRAWCEGRTGFPIVDAGMRELNATGFMHNRVRMITASFLVKDLHIDWRKGERYFAQKLVDYDPCVNNGNWQWAASTGCDHQPYFRIFNPWLQQKRFDLDCVYIRRWVPELKNVNAAVIHGWADGSSGKSEYPRPIVDHGPESIKAKEMFKAIKSD